jgi:hypothetical protein
MVDSLLDKFSIQLYHEEKIILKKSEEGYNEINAGYGRNSSHAGNTRTRLARILVFYKPKNKIFTYQHNKYYVGKDPFSFHSPPFDKEYSKKEFEEFVKKQEVVLETKKNLSDIVKVLNN